MATSLLLMQAGSVGCFSADHLGIEVSEESDRCIIRLKHAHDGPCSAECEPPWEVTREEATAFLSAVCKTIEQPECGEQGRSTTRYYAEVDVLIGSTAIPLKCSSSAMPREALEELADDLQVNANTREKAKQLLGCGYHVWAHELYFLAHSLMERRSQSDRNATS